MIVNLDNLDNTTQEKYREFKTQVEGLLVNYQSNDRQRFELVKRKIEQTNGLWEHGISLESKGKKENVDITYLLAYEYCLATERITHGKITFEEKLDELFNGVKKFRIGNPIPGIDDECLYGKGIDDKTSIPITSKKYRKSMTAGAQHLEYCKNGELIGAVFMFEKGVIEDFAHDENGTPISMPIDGIDFRNLGNSKQSLLTNFRQTTFHEWNHCSEIEFIDAENVTLPYEYTGVDGKKYRNYQKIDTYVVFEGVTEQEEPEYIYGTIDEKNDKKRFYYIDENGNKRTIDDYIFPLQENSFVRQIVMSQGLETREVLEDGTIKMQNIITEGFVEASARAMIRAIDPGVTDIDTGKYPEQVEIAYKVIESRDNSFGKGGEGQTYADFLRKSTVLKADLESRIVMLSDGTQVDGLHYISDFANRVQIKETPRKAFVKRMGNLSVNFKLDNNQLDVLKESNLWGLAELTQKQQEELKALMMASGKADKTFVDSVLQEYLKVLSEEKCFYDSIPEKLGYETRNKKVEDLGAESLPSQCNISLLSAIEEQEKTRDKAEELLVKN